MNILIVDDETVIREGIHRTLQSRFPQFGLFQAATPEEAAELMSSHQIHIVLTDVLMPGMTGLELMRISRNRHPHTKWVVISAYTEFTYALEAVRLGAKDYLLKPIGKDVLVEMIGKLGDEIHREAEQTEVAEMVKNGRKYLREAVFQRLAAGLSIGSFDIAPFMESHPYYHLVLVRMESDKVVHLEHFMIENVLSELIEKHGRGFVTIQDGQSLLGLVTLNEDAGLSNLLDELRSHLKKCLRIPFQIIHTGRIERFEKVPEEVRRMRQTSAAQMYEHSAAGGEKAVEVALQYMQAHFHEELSLEKVAAIVYLNPVYFSQLFKQKTGHGFKEHIIDLRMERAKQMLHNPQAKLADVAERIGYQDMRHFATLFRKKYGVTPSEYRLQANSQEHELNGQK